MRALHLTALLLCLSATAAHAATDQATANSRLIAAEESSPATDNSGTGTPGSDNAGTGSNATTASPS